MDNNEWEKIFVEKFFKDAHNKSVVKNIVDHITSLLAARDEYWKGQLKELQRRFDTNTLT